MPIVLCTCECEFQDKRYGKQRRVANYTAKGQGRCTQCSALHNVPNAPVVKKKTGTGRGGAKKFIALPPPNGWPGGRHEDNGWRPM